MNRNRLAAATAVVWGLVCLPVLAKTGHSDQALMGAMEAERAGDFDKAYELIQAALTAKPGDMAYQLEGSRIRFETAAHHVHHAQQLRDSGKTAEALKEFEEAYAIDPSSGLAAQEIRRTKQMLKEPAGEGALTPIQKQRKDEEARIDSIQPVPELRAFSSVPINLTMTNRPKVLFDTLGRLAGVNVIFDPDYEAANPIKQQTIEITSTMTSPLGLSTAAISFSASRILFKLTLAPR